MRRREKDHPQENLRELTMIWTIETITLWLVATAINTVRRVRGLA